MATTDPALLLLIDRVLAAQAGGETLAIRGGGTKDFYGEAVQGEPLDVTVLKGISSYEPTELVVTARCGTPLAELEAALAKHQQHLPFEPPHFDRATTVGGMVAAGLSGPARANAGALRDHVLGASLLNGRGEVMNFGGQVIKNVAGYDISRLLAGSMGTLGVILEVSLKVMPRPSSNATLRFHMEQPEALQRINTWCGQPLPIHASAWWDGSLLVRLVGALAAVQAAVSSMGGDTVDPGHAAPFWAGLRNHTDEYFVNARAALSSGGVALWRVSVPPTAAPLMLPGEQLIEWHGALRWLVTSASAAKVREAAAAAGGHATLFAARDKSAGVFTPLSPPIARIHRELKKAFDPSGVFNTGRLYPDW